MQRYDDIQILIRPAPAANPPVGFVEIFPDSADSSKLKSKLPNGTVQNLVNIQSDWTQTDNTKDDFIKNKPSISGGTGEKFLIKDVKTAGTAGGTFTSGAWRTRVLNTSQWNGITNASLDTTTSRFTLPAGTYHINATAPGFRIDTHQCRIYNITDEGIAGNGVGTVTYAANNASSPNTSYSIVDAIFTITAAKVFELQHRCTNTRTTDGFGVAGSFEVAIFSTVMISKIG